MQPRFRSKILLILVFSCLMILLSACGDSNLSINASTTTVPGTTASTTTVPTTASTTIASTTASATTVPVTTIPVTTNPPTATTTVAATTEVVTTPPPASSPTPVATTPPIQITIPATSTPTINSNPLANTNLLFDDGNERIFTYNYGNGKRTEVAQGASPIFSPDALQIAYIRTVGTSYSSQNPYIATIYAQNVDGSNQRQLCQAPKDHIVRLIRWSPRSRFIALEASQIQVGPTDLYLCNLTNNQITKFPISSGQQYAVFDWTPDGENAVWQAKNPATGKFELAYGDPEKPEAATFVTNSQYARSTQSNGQPYREARIALDGRSIMVFGEKVFIVSVPGQQSPFEGKVLSSIPAGGSRFVWAPDSRKLAFVTYDSNSSKRLVDVVYLDNDSITAILQSDGFSVDWA